MKSYKFRLYPGIKTEQKLEYVLEKCRYTYNTFLGMLNKQKVIDKSLIQGMLPDMKICEPVLKNVHSKTLQYECYRLFSNLKSLVELKKNGYKVGRLRFKGKGWFRSFTYNQSGFKIELTGNRCQSLHLSKIGEIPIRMHRTVKGKMKQITIKKTPSGKWFAYIITGNKSDKVNQRMVKTVVGIDVGKINFTMDSNGTNTIYPMFLKESLDKLAKEQRKLSKKKKKSKNGIKQRVKVALVNEKVVNQRDNFLHQLSRRYVNAYDCISVEDLNIKNIIKMDHNCRNTMDVSWGKFLQMMSYKASSAGKMLVKVNPRGTSQRCSRCGDIVKKELWMRVHKCSKCGLELDRDLNSAKEILRLGLQKIPQELWDLKLVETEPLLYHSGKVSSVGEAGSSFQNQL